MYTKTVAGPPQHMMTIHRYQLSHPYLTSSCNANSPQHVRLFQDIHPMIPNSILMVKKLEIG